MKSTKAPLLIMTWIGWETHLDRNELLNKPQHTNWELLYLMEPFYGLNLTQLPWDSLGQYSLTEEQTLTKTLFGDAWPREPIWVSTLVVSGKGMAFVLKRIFQKIRQSNLLQDKNISIFCIWRLNATITKGKGRYLMKHKKKIKITTLKIVALSKASASSR